MTKTKAAVLIAPWIAAAAVAVFVTPTSGILLGIFALMQNAAVSETP